MLKTKCKLYTNTIIKSDTESETDDYTTSDTDTDVVDDDDITNQDQSDDNTSDAEDIIVDNVSDLNTTTLPLDEFEPEENERIRRAKLTINEMLEDRGYTLVEETKEKSLYMNANSKIIYVFIYTAEKMNKEDVRRYICILDNDKVSRAIVAYNTITSQTKPLLDKLSWLICGESNKPKKLNIESFTISELQYNVTKHVLTPRHQKAEQSEKLEIQALYKNSNGVYKIPKISSNDVIVRYYGFKANDIIRITRNNGFVTYRVVIAGR